MYLSDDFGAASQCGPLVYHNTISLRHDRPVISRRKGDGTRYVKVKARVHLDRWALSLSGVAKGWDRLVSYKAGKDISTTLHDAATAVESTSADVLATEKRYLVHQRFHAPLSGKKKTGRPVDGGAVDVYTEVYT